MKYLKQFLIILLISFIGEILKAVLPLPVPASIYGMAILFVCLVMASWGVLKPMLVPVVVITVVVLVAVMAVSGRVAQAIIRHERSKKSNE